MSELTAKEHLAEDRYRKTAPQMTKDDTHKFAPALGWYTDEILFARNWERGELTKRDRSIVTISALIAGAHVKQMVGHFNRGLANGVAPKELQEIVTHLAFYTGWPCAMSSVSVMQSVFETKGISAKVLSQENNTLLPRGTEAQRQGAFQKEFGEGLSALAEFDCNTLNGDLWRRPELSRRDRSLVTISALIALGDDAVLPDEVSIGLENGLKAFEVIETLTHLAFYTGWPKVIRASRAVGSLLKG